MNIWLTQRAEPTPHDLNDKRRPMRTGLMAEYIAEKGENVTWWTGDFDHYGQRQRRHNKQALFVSPGYHVKYLQAEGYQRSYSLQRLKYDRSIAHQFVQETRCEKLPDIILASMPSVDLALESVRFGVRHGVPVIVDIRDLHPDVFVETAPSYLKPAIYLATHSMDRKVRRLLRGATAIWGNSDKFVEWGCSKASRSRSELDLTLPIAYKPVEVAETETRNYLADWRESGTFEPNHLHSLFIGTLSKSFNFLPIFDAAERLEFTGSRHRFHFFGTGEQQPLVEGKCNSLSNCHYHGPVGAGRLQAAMSVSAVGLAPYVPSKNFTYNMPNKPTEYLGGGLAVAMSFEEGLLPKFLKETGAGFSYKDGLSLSQELTQLLEEPRKLETMRLAARVAFREHLDYEMLSHRMLTALRNVVNSHVSYKIPKE